MPVWTTGFGFIPPSAGSVLVANMLHVDLGIMIAVGVPVGYPFPAFCRNFMVKIYSGRRDLIRDFSSNIQEVREEEEANLPILCHSIMHYSGTIDFDFMQYGFCVHSGN